MSDDAQPAPVSLPHAEDFVAAYRRLSSEIAAGVAVLTCVRAGRAQAITVDSYLDVSWDPPTMVVSVYSGSRVMETLDVVDRCVISVLSDRQKGTAQWLGEPGQPLYGILDSTPTHSSPAGLPIISAALAFFELRIVDRLEVATHTLLVGEVSACGPAGGPGHPSTGRPLIRFAETYGSFAARTEPGTE